MPNYLKMPKKSQVLALLELGWSYRRIEAETGVRRETVSRLRCRRAGQMRPKRSPAPIPSPPVESADASATAIQMRPKRSPARGQTRPKRSPARPPRRGSPPRAYRDAIAEKLDAGLSLQRIWQDLVEESGYGASYESVKRFVRTLAPTRRAVGVFHCAPGAEGTSRFLPRRADARRATGEWRRPWVFRMTLGHSRHGYAIHAKVGHVDNQKIRGPRSSLTGSMMMPRTTPSTPSTATPTMRNGINRTHTSGYTTRANSASGQHSTRRMHQTRKLPTPGYTMAREIRSGRGASW